MLGFFGGPDKINGYEGSPVVLGVVWTLQKEWLFYLSLLITSFAAREARTHLPFTVIGLIVSLVYVAWQVEASIVAPWPVCMALFFTGMLCASLQKNNLSLKLPNTTASVLVLALTVTVFALFPTTNQASPIILIGLAFFLMVSGCDLFGLLSSRTARRLGNISYGLYLLHLPILALVFSMAPIKTFALGSPLQHWTMVLLCAVLLIVVATAAHVWIERTGIELGNRVSMKLAAQKGRLKMPVTNVPASTG